MSRRGWVWPVGLAVASFGSLAAVVLRGCWHGRMSWPIKDEHSGDFSYQVCVNCGVKRLFDEQSFRAFGPCSYDLHELIARERLRRLQRVQRAAVAVGKAAAQTEHIPQPASPEPASPDLRSPDVRSEDELILTR